MKNKKILLITWNYPPKIGGIENLLSELVKQVRPTTEVEIIAPWAEILERNQKGVHRPGMRGLLWFFIFAFFKGSQLLRRAGSDVVFGGSVLTAPVVFLLGRIHRKPAATYAHGLDLVYDNWLYQKGIRYLLPKLDLVITNSSQTKDIARDTGAPAESIEVIHPGINAEDFQRKEAPEALKKKYGLGGRFVILYVGRLAKRKGIPEFIEYALPDIVRNNDRAVFCVIGGNPETSLTHKLDIKQLIQQKTKEGGLEEHVRLLGWVERDALIDLYFASDIFVLPAIYIPDDMEGFGIVLAEANAAGKPVVSSAIGGIQDAVANHQSGYLIEPGDWEDYATTIIKLMEDSDLRSSLGSFGRARIESELDWPVIGQKFITIINQLG